MLSGAALLLAAALAGGGQAAARAGDPGPRQAGQAAGIISTVAGGVGGPGPAMDVAIASPAGVMFSGGYLYVADGGSVRKVSPQTGWLTTPAGTGTHGLGGDGVPAVRAELDDAFAVGAGPSGSLLITGYDPDNYRIEMVAGTTGTFYGRPMTAGDIYTVVSPGVFFASGVTTDSAGNMLIAAAGDSQVKVMADSTGTFYGQPMTAGGIYAIAGDGTCGFSGDGGPASTAQLCGPGSVAVDGAGNLVIGDAGNQRIRVVADSTGTFYGIPMTAGNIYTVAGNGTGQYNNDLGSGGFSGDGGPAASAELAQPGTIGQQGLAVDGAGNLVIADSSNNRIRVAAKATGTFYGQPMTAGDIYTVAGDGTAGYSGDGGPAASAGLSSPGWVAADRAGNLVIADSRSFRVRVVAGSTGIFYGQPMTAGDIYTVAGDGTAGFSGDGGPAASAELGFLGGVAVDRAGDLLIADGNRVRLIAEHTGIIYGKHRVAGDIYNVAGTGHAKFSGDGGPATQAAVNAPSDVVVDHAGNLLIADTSNQRIRMVAARTGTAYGQAVTAGDIYTVAGSSSSGGFSGDGGPAASAQLNNPYGVTVDAAGNLVIADTENRRIRVAAESTGSFYGIPMTAGNIYTIAGSALTGFTGDGGLATSAGLTVPTGMAVRAGNLLFADLFSERVRKVTG
ncbi:MAG TPA: hypothetical protein VGL63_11535 [Streptosporangiaceae bacterium]